MSGSTQHVDEQFPSATLVLIRHGQARASDNSYGQDTPLSSVGRQQAILVADALARRSIATVYTSPWPRAVQTAAPLAQRLDLPLNVDPRLAEFDFGSQPFDVVQQRPDLVAWRPEHRGTEHGETLQAFSARVAAFCADVVDGHLGACVVVFTHSGVIDAALRWAVGLPPGSAWQHDFDLATASMTEIEWWPRGRVLNGAPQYATIRRVGDVAHLGELVSDI